MRILVVIPTTAGPIIVRSLKPRRALPASAAFADGDYRPLIWSGDYARLTGPDGPLSGRGISRPEPYELRLSGSFDTGRSWEAPVALAHGLLERGHDLVADPADAEMILWATGALDLDLRLIRAPYALLDKVEQTEALFQVAPKARIAALLPPDDEEEAATTRLEDLVSGRLVKLGGRDVQGALAEIETPSHAPSSHMPKPKRLGTVGLVSVAALLVVAAVGGFVGLKLELSHKPASVPFADAGSPRPAAADPAPAAPRPELAPIIIEELLAPPGQSCRSVVFGAVPPVRREVALAAPQTFETSRNTADLCGLSFRPRDGKTASFQLSQNLKTMSITPSRLSDGSEVLFFRDGIRQNVVYAVQVSVLEGGATKPLAAFTHALVP